MNDQPQLPAPVIQTHLTHRGVALTNVAELWDFAVKVSKSGLAPQGIKTPEAAFCAIEMGLELGLSPMQALQNIAVISGRPSIYGDAALALVRASGLLQDFEEHIAATRLGGFETTSHCRDLSGSTRRGRAQRQLSA